MIKTPDYKVLVCVLGLGRTPVHLQTSGMKPDKFFMRNAGDTLEYL